MAQVDEKEGELLTLLPNKKISLNNAHNIRREIASVYRDMRNGKIETQDGTRLGFMLNLLLRAYDTCVLQDKIESIENTIYVREKDAKETKRK